MDDPFAELFQKFVARTKDDARRLRQLETQIAAPLSPAYDEMRGLIHRLAGSAGTFGFDHLSQTAAELDNLMSNGCSDEGLMRRHLVSLLTEIDAMPDGFASNTSR